MHEFTIRSPRDIRDPVQVREDTLREQMTGEAAEEVLVFNKPLRIASAGGSLYITDTRANIVHVFDIPHHRYYAFGYRLEGNLSKPIGIALDGKRNVYVADQGRNRIVMYDRFGLFQRFIGERHGFSRLTAVAVTVDGGRIYALDTGGLDSAKHEIAVFSGSGEFLQTIGSRGEAVGQLNLPIDIALTPEGNVVVLDAGNFRVQIFDPNGRFVRTWGQAGNGLGQLARPRGLAVDPAGLIYVSDSFFSNVQVFTPDGKLLLALGENSLEPGPGHFALIAGLAIDETSRLYVVDQYFNKVDVIRKLLPTVDRKQRSRDK